MHVAHFFSYGPPLFLFRSFLSWHYPNSPKNRKTALSPCPDWLQRGSSLKKDPLRIWFYPQ
ncbi:serine/threonine protein kinase [Salmonella enterica]|nr:serine/threonine protein kinase [Salmonella enterica]